MGRYKHQADGDDWSSFDRPRGCGADNLLPLPMGRGMGMVGMYDCTYPSCQEMILCVVSGR